jgi:hypothetical protein
MKPTPGPWELDDDEQHIDGIGRVHMHRVVAPNGAVVVEFSNTGCSEIIYDDDGEGTGRHYDLQAMANAHLIAAAPDILEALEKIIAAADSQAAQGGEMFYSEAVGGPIDAARTAIAKARGAT